jgi:hypothetical protein
MMGSMFGAYAPPQGGMFGQQQQQSPLMQMLGGGGGGANPQLLQLAQQLMSAGGPQRMPMGATGVQSPSMFGGAPAGMGMGQPQMGLPQLLQLLGGAR